MLALTASNRRRATLFVAALAIVGGLVASPAYAATTTNEDGSEADRPGLVAWEGPVPEDIDLSSYRPQPGEMPEEISEGIWDMELSVPAVSVNSYEWIRESESLRIYSAEEADYWEPLLARFFAGQKVEIHPAKHSKAEIDAVMDTIVARGGVLESGDRVVMATPAKDGSQITIGLDSSLGVTRMSPNSLADSLGTEIPLVVNEAPEVESSLRNNTGTYSFVAGNGMSTTHVDPGYINVCTTGWLVGRLDASARGMLSADHCGSGKPSTSWWYSWTQNSNTVLGTFQGQLSGLAASDLGLWTGGQIADKGIPAVYVGSYTNATQADWVRGGNYPALGTDVCYSGSRSGNVCDNEVIAQGLTVCYDVFQCYAGISMTSQRDSIEAAGNGDSGGPVYQMVGGQLNASGIISGRVGGSSTCTGDPGESGGRQCSPVNLFAPIIAALSGTDWGLAYMP